MSKLNFPEKAVYPSPKLGKPAHSNRNFAHRRGRVAARVMPRSLYAAGMASTDDPSQRTAQPAPSRSSTHAEQSISEDAITAAARERADDSGAGAVTPPSGALLSVLAKLAGAKAVVEVGHRRGRQWAVAAVGDARRRRAHHDRRRARASAAGQAGVRRGRHRPVADPADQRPRPGRADPARRRVLRPGVHRRRSGRPAPVRRRGRPAAAVRRRDRRAPGRPRWPRRRRQRRTTRRSARCARPPG